MNHILSSIPKLNHPKGQWYSVENNFRELREKVCVQNSSSIWQNVSCGGRAVRLNFSQNVGRGYFDFLDLGEDLTVILADATFFEDQCFKLRGENWLRFHFRVKLDNSLLFGKNMQFDLSGPMAQLILMPDDLAHTDWMMANSSMRWLSIYCRKHTLTETLGFDLDQLPTTLTNYIVGQGANFSIDHFSFPSAALEAINSLFSVPVSDPMKIIYTRTRTLEAICLFLEGMIKFSQDQHIISRIDENKLFEARHIIEKDPSASLSMKMLSRQVGLNRNKLSTGFRKIFGISVFEFQRKKRLELAWNMLKDTQIPISQVALAAGYNHQSTFSAAFKKAYGIPPKMTPSKK